MSMIGKTLGTFECTSLLSKGGMGEVYRAKDQKLGRDVAIKVLPEEFAKDADRVARFQREAKPRKMPSLKLPWVAAAVILSLIVAGLAVWYLKPSEPRQLMRFDYELPEGQQFSSLDSQPSLAISPTGKQIVYSTPEGLYLRSIDELTARLIVGTEGETREPFFSPDGKWIGYFTPIDRQMKKISIN